MTNRIVLSTSHTWTATECRQVPWRPVPVGILPNRRRPFTLLMASDSHSRRREFEAAAAQVDGIASAVSCDWRGVVPGCGQLSPDAVVLDGCRETAHDDADLARRLRESGCRATIVLLAVRATASDTDLSPFDVVLSAESGMTSALEALSVLLSGAVIAVGPQRDIAADAWEGDHAERQRLSSLTGREREIMELIVDGLSNRQIGSRLHITPNTVKEHVSRIFAKLEVAGRLEAAVLATRTRVNSAGN